VNQPALLCRQDDRNPALDLELVHQVGHVVLDRLFGQTERDGDLAIGLTLEQPFDNLHFAPAEFRDRHLTRRAISNV